MAGRSEERKQATSQSYNPQYIYSYMYDTNKLYRTDLLTAEETVHHLEAYRLSLGCCLTELPAGPLLVTGGGPSSEVVMIDTSTFEVVRQPALLTPRHCHAAVYHDQHLYVLGGVDTDYLSDCERFVLPDSRWEPLPPLPIASADISAVVVAKSLYALVGREACRVLDLIQMLSLVGFVWQVLSLRLPRADWGIPCFQLMDDKIYILLKKTLYAFHTQTFQLQPLKTLPDSISSRYGPSYYSRGVLYCASHIGPARSMDIGSLSS